MSSLGSPLQDVHSWFRRLVVAECPGEKARLALAASDLLLEAMQD